MFRISKETDYGVLLLTLMARGPDSVSISARELSQRSGLPLPMVSKILKLLARGGVLSSQRGPKGGYALTRRPDRISVADVVAALEGPVSITECIEHPGDCRQEATCGVRGNWAVINTVVREALSRVSLVEMTKPFPDRQLIPLQTQEPELGSRQP
jgi:FeS assembly SUF system regulator